MQLGLSKNKTHIWGKLGFGESNLIFRSISLRQRTFTESGAVITGLWRTESPGEDEVKASLRNVILITFIDPTRIKIEVRTSEQGDFTAAAVVSKMNEFTEEHIVKWREIWNQLGEKARETGPGKRAAPEETSDTEEESEGEENDDTPNGGEAAGGGSNQSSGATSSIAKKALRTANRDREREAAAAAKKQKNNEVRCLAFNHNLESSVTILSFYRALLYESRTGEG